MQSNLAEPLMTGGPARDLDAARRAYDLGGAEAIEASRKAHTNVGSASEEHESGGGNLKAIVFGGLDGILTSFAILAGAVGAHLGPVPILALGVSNVLADALSLGAGEFLSSRSYNAYLKKERDREAWELDNFREGEIQEMIELFVARGMSQTDAEEVIKRMARYKVFA
jgi:VIT1/CCC1 family predicted Fe2+/Mn2+ transporter